MSVVTRTSAESPQYQYPAAQTAPVARSILARYFSEEARRAQAASADIPTVGSEDAPAAARGGPEAPGTVEPEHGDDAATLREQIEQHKSDPTCYACHKAIDPYGFALEGFDATGQWRTKYRIKQPHRGTFQYRLEGYYKIGAEVDASGEIDRNKFEDVFGLKRVLLSDHRKIAYNFAKKFFEYANGYQPSLEQRLDLLDLIDEKPEDCRMKDLVIDVLMYSVTEVQPR